MAKKKTQQKKQRGGMASYIGSFFHGRVFDLDFFKRNWIAVAFVVMICLGYITNKYTCMTKKEEIRRLESRLEIVNNECIRTRSLYMGRIRESSMTHMVDSLHLNLQVQEQPPFRLPKD